MSAGCFRPWDRNWLQSPAFRMQSEFYKCRKHPKYGIKNESIDCKCFGLIFFLIMNPGQGDEMRKNTRLKKKILVFFFSLGYLFLLQGEDNRQNTGQETGNFKFAFIMLKNGEPVFINDPHITGEILRRQIILYYEPITYAYIYLYIIAPGREFRQIRPVSFKDFARRNYFYQAEYIYFSDILKVFKDEDTWEIHFLVSTRQLPGIESLLSQLSGISPENKTALSELTYKLEKTIRNLQVKKVLGKFPVEYPESVSNPFRADSYIESWLDKNTGVTSFTDICESIYYYELEKKP